MPNRFVDERGMLPGPRVVGDKHCSERQLRVGQDTLLGLLYHVLIWPLQLPRPLLEELCIHIRLHRILWR